MKSPLYQFIPSPADNATNPGGFGAVMPSIKLSDGSQVTLGSWDNLTPRQHKRRALSLPNVATRNELGQKIVDLLNRESSNEYTVIGTYDDGGGRYAQAFAARDADSAERKALAEQPNLIIAGTVRGSVVMTS